MIVYFEMQKALLIVAVACLVSCEKSLPMADLEVPPPEYQLVLADKVVVEAYSRDLRTWLNSLYQGLGYDQDSMEQELFMLSNLSVTGGGGPYPVYQSTENRLRFYVKDLGYVIDFEAGKIGTLGVAGISAHFPPSQRIVVLLCPTKGVDFMGVNLGDPKTDSISPTFTANKVAF